MAATSKIQMEMAGEDLRRIFLERRLEEQPPSAKKKWETGKFRSWGLGLRHHIAIDSSLKGMCGRHGACGSVVQLDHDGEFEPMHGYFGAIEAGIEMQRTIHRAELTEFGMVLGLCVPATVHMENVCILKRAPWRDDVHWPESQRSR